MPYLIECYEWRLIQNLGSLLEERKAHFSPRHPTSRNVSIKGAEIYHKIFEVELRQIFIFKECALNLSESIFEECQEKLSKLCRLLDSLVQSRFASGDSGHRSGPLDRSPTNVNFDYPLLSDLIRHLEAVNYEGSREFYDLASGSHETLFKIPEGTAQLKDSLQTVTEWNEFSLKLSPASRDPPHRPSTKATTRVWSDTNRRCQATRVLGTLFERFTCGLPHEVMLKLPEESVAGVPVPELRILLPCCPATDRWQEALYDLQERWGDNSSVSEVRNVCEDLQQLACQNTGLRLVVRQYGLFSSWAERSIEEHCLKPSQKQSLEEVINSGAFKRPDLGSLFGKHSVTRYSLTEKRALAVQLGYCLMDFFDTQLNSRRLHFFLPEGGGTRKEQLYLSFSPDFPSSPEFCVFRVGHPVLLSFAKILLEIDYGEAIPIEISLQHDENKTAWVELLDWVEMMEAERDDSYLQAVRGCLTVHYQIAKSLRSDESSGGDVDPMIRREIYREIVRKLEFGLEESTPRAYNKRKRSESPPPVARKEPSFKHRLGERPIQSNADDFLNGTPCKKVTRWRPTLVVQRQLTRPRTPDMQEKRAFGPAPYQPRIASTYDLDDNSQAAQTYLSGSCGLFDDNTPVKYSADMCRYADDYMTRHISTYAAVIEDVYDEESAIVETEANNPDPIFPAKGSRIKVAIFDTGVDMDHLDIKAREERIKDVRSWVDGGDGKQDWRGGDVSGHGTHITSLLLDISPDSDVYIARIAKHNPINPGVIAKALMHAVNEWQVDIISMSFGFADETEYGCSALAAAIAAAHTRGVLMFAAASNSGSHEAPAFPARHSAVFCMFASDGKGNAGPANPTALSHAYNFSTLGQAVESAWPSALCAPGENRRRRSGTSFAAPVAAGIAATILLYARQNLSGDEALRFKEYGKMRDMLYLMSDFRGGYNVISMTEFFRETREYINITMRRILVGRWKK